MSNYFDNDYYDDKTITREFGLKYPHIGYKNYVQSVTATSSAAGFPASNLETPFTYEIWKSGVFPVTITADLGSPRAIDYVGIALHNAAGKGLTISGSTNGVDYVELAFALITINNAAMIIFEETTVRYVKLYFGGSGDPTLSADFVEQQYILEPFEDSADVIEMSILNIGKTLQCQRMSFGGNRPAVLNRKTEKRPSISEGGQWLGRSVIRNGTPFNFSFDNLTGNWYRANFDPFAVHAITLPFFICLRPLGYASECIFGWTTDDDIEPQNMGVRDWLSVSFDVVGAE